LLSTQEREVISQLPRNSAMLIVIAGPNKGSRFLINDAETVLGRDPQSEIFLDDVTVSRKHAKIYRVPSGDYAIEDLGSLNGSYVNGTSVTDSRLTVGDEVQIGKFRLTYFTGKGNA
jgi:pSer/pThr/pTyr-binding forkhead associated (FHA) protein